MSASERENNGEKVKEKRKTKNRANLKNRRINRKQVATRINNREEMDYNKPIAKQNKVP